MTVKKSSDRWLHTMMMGPVTTTVMWICGVMSVVATTIYSAEEGVAYDAAATDGAYDGV
jgi:hypothetical protein